MEREESFPSFPDSIASTSDLSSSSSSSSSSPSDHYYDAVDNRPVCEYEEFCYHSWRSAATGTTDESGFSSRILSIGPQASGHADALWEEELQELEAVRKEVLWRLSRQVLGADLEREARARSWLRLVDNMVGVVKKLHKRRKSRVLLLSWSWWQYRDALKLREAITALGSAGKALLDALRPALVGHEQELLQIERSVGAEGIPSIICIKGRKGIGKTRLLQECLKGKSGEIRFDAVIWLTTPFGMPTSRLQEDAARQMGLPLADHQAGEEEPRTALHAALSRSRFLLVLDDLRGALDLEAIGVPRPGSGSPSKIVVTSRSEEVCTNMGADLVIDVPVLPEEKTWQLFRNEVGIAALDNPEAIEMARELVPGCLGVPSVLLGLAEAMKDVRSIDEWRRDRCRDRPFLLRELRARLREPEDRMVHVGGGRFYRWEDIEYSEPSVGSLLSRSFSV